MTTPNDTEAGWEQRYAAPASADALKSRLSPALALAIRSAERLVSRGHAIRADRRDMVKPGRFILRIAAAAAAALTLGSPAALANGPNSAPAEIGRAHV